MRGDVVFRIYGCHEGRERDSCFGTYRTEEEARTEIATLQAREMNGKNWAAEYHNKGFVVRRVVVETNFDLPSLPKPRDAYAVKVTARNAPGTWASSSVEVFRRTDSASGLHKVGEYVRNYAMLHTFEPFRQGGHDCALISRSYTLTAVLDLATGAVIAEETEDQPGSGFCPVGFMSPTGGTCATGRSSREARAGTRITNGHPATSASCGGATGATTRLGRCNTSTSARSGMASSTEMIGSASSR